MRGSLLITFDEYSPQLGTNGYNITVNNEPRYTQYHRSNNLYSTYLEVGDVVTIELIDEGLYNSDISVIRLDYTTDDDGGDFGIKTTGITGVTTSSPTTFTFTASTRNDSYDFEYRISSSIDNCLTIGLGITRTGSVQQRPYELVYKNNKLFIVGAFTTYSGITTDRFVVLEDSGQIDSTFIPNLFSGGTQDLTRNTSIRLQTDNKILIGGQFTSYSGVSKNNIIRLNTDYSIDNSFNMGTGVNNIVNVINYQSNDKIFLGGQFTTYNGTTTGNLIKLNIDGTLDSGFTINQITNSNVSDINLQSTGKIICCGGNVSILSNTVRSVFRFNSNGTYDNTFTSPFTTGQTFVRKAYVLSDDKILIATIENNFTKYFDRLNSNGSIDNTFLFDEDNENECVDFLLTSDNKILIMTAKTNIINTYQKIYKLNYDGTIDNSFNSIQLNGLPVTLSDYNMIEKPDGDFVIVGNFTQTSIGNYSGIIQIDKNGNSKMCSVCPFDEISITGFTESGYTGMNGIYQRITSYTGGTLDYGYLERTGFITGNFKANTLYPTNNAKYIVYGKNDGVTYYTLLFRDGYTGVPQSFPSFGIHQTPNDYIVNGAIPVNESRRISENDYYGAVYEDYRYLEQGIYFQNISITYPSTNTC